MKYISNKTPFKFHLAYNIKLLTLFNGHCNGISHTMPVGHIVRSNILEMNKLEQNYLHTNT